MPSPIDVLSLPGSQSTPVVTGQGYFPVITHLGDKSLLVALRGGSGHMGLGGRLDVVHSHDGGVTWESPITVADSERDDRNPAMGMAADGTVVFAYHWQGSYGPDGMWDPDSRKVDTRVVRSRDRGVTWVEDRLLGFEPLNGASPFGKIRCDTEGVLYMPIYQGEDQTDAPGAVICGEGRAASRILRSSNNGESWGEPIHVARGLNEADFLMLADDDWLFAGRSETRGEQCIYTCRSADRGKTWGELQAVTGKSEHPPDLTDLGDGVILLTYGRRHEPFGLDGRVSTDSGRTWLPHRLQFATDLPGTDIGYPSTALLDSGRLITVYYRAGTREKPNDGYNALDASCVAVCYDREALLTAVEA